MCFIAKFFIYHFQLWVYHFQYKKIKIHSKKDEVCPNMVWKRPPYWERGRSRQCGVSHWKCGISSSEGEPPCSNVPSPTYIMLDCACRNTRPRQCHSVKKFSLSVSPLGLTPLPEGEVIHSPSARLGWHLSQRERSYALPPGELARRKPWLRGCSFLT